MKIGLLFLILVSGLSTYSQVYPPFQGKLIYEVRFQDSVNPQHTLNSLMVVYTNDTLVRVETESPQLGKQILIKNLPLKKYYLLLEFEEKKFAIQHNEQPDTIPTKYTFKKKLGHKTIAGIKAKKIEVGLKKMNKKYIMYYSKKMNPVYLEAIKGIPGLPLEYDIQTEEGVYHYLLKEISYQKPDKDLFGIPSTYKRMTFDEFIQQMGASN